MPSDLSNASCTVEMLEVGKVIRPHGVGGAIKILLYNPASHAFETTPHMELQSPSGKFSGAYHVIGHIKGGLILVLEGVTDRKQAESWVGARVFVPREDLDPLDPGQYYYADLVGCTIFDEDDHVLGEVHDVFEAGASDVLVIRRGSEERMVPLLEDWIIDINLDSKQIRIRGAADWAAYKA